MTWSITTLTGDGKNIIDAPGLPPGVEDTELETPEMRDHARPADAEILNPWD